jgi:membrane fusion protein (multidrug efflux system)
MNPRLIVHTALLSALIVSGGCSKDCGGNNSPKAAALPPTPVIVARVEKENVPIVREFVARTEASATVTVEARVQAILETMEFEEGKRVEADQVLYQLVPDTYEANLAAAEAGLAKAMADQKLAEEQVSVRAAEAAVNIAHAQLGKAKQDVARFRPLAEQDAVPQQDLDTAISAQQVAEAELDSQQANLENSRIRETVGILQARALVEAAAAAVALARLEMEYCIIRSPIDGLIGRTMVDVGNLVGRSGNTNLVTVSSVDPMRATLSISEAEFLHFQEEDRKRQNESGGERERGGATVELLLADDSVYAHKGEVIMAERAVAIETGTLQLVAEFPNPDGLLRPGQFGRVRATVGERKGAILVPQRAIMEQQSAKIVYIVLDDNTVALRSVQVGERYKGNFVVLNGLQENARVIVEGQIKVRPGMTVTTTDKPALSNPDTAPEGR